MNTNTTFELIQKSFRVTLGATATLIEVLQDPQRRDENLTKLRTEFGELAEEWAAKGEMTEQEARNFVDGLLNRQPASSGSSESQAYSTTPSATVTSPEVSNVQIELQELTAQIAAIRTELEKLREQEP